MEQNFMNGLEAALEGDDALAKQHFEHSNLQATQYLEAQQKR